LAPPSEGELLQGHVDKANSSLISDTNWNVWFPSAKSSCWTAPIYFKVGDIIDVMVDRHGPPPEGCVLLSFQGQPPAHLGHVGTDMREQFEPALGS
jgi:hypothetical protein